MVDFLKLILMLIAVFLSLVVPIFHLAFGTGLEDRQVAYSVLLGTGLFILVY